MATSRLAVLYEKLMKNKGIEDWHDRYKRFCEEIQNRFDKNNPNTLDDVIKISTRKKTIEEHSLLYSIVYHIDNGISTLNGIGKWSCSDYDVLKSKDDFRKMVFELLSNPYDKYSDEDFFNKIEQYKLSIHKKYHLLYKRMLAASYMSKDDDRIISTLFNEYKFNDIINYIKKNKYIGDSDVFEWKYFEEKNNWLEKNEYFMKALRKEFGLINGIDKYYISMFLWIFCESIQLVKKFNPKKAIIKYGSPGTGKTWSAKNDSKQIFDFWCIRNCTSNTLSFEDCHELVQFHPSYSYEDFMEGLRPVPDKQGQVELKLVNGQFKDFCLKAGRWERDLYSLGDEEWNTLKKSNVADLKNWCKDNKERHPFLTQSYWKDFLGSLDKDLCGDKPFIDVLPPYFFIIDEINRAELSRVFGELLYCLEYRGPEGKIKTQYARLAQGVENMIKGKKGIEAENASGSAEKVDDNTTDNNDKTAETSWFFIPSNLYIIGTMNTIDRSVESFDFALRRRFVWEEVLPNYDAIKGQENCNYAEELSMALEKLNAEISKMTEFGLGPEYQIGHAYCMNLSYDSDNAKDIKEKIWNDSLQSLLQEYLRGVGGAEGKLETLQKAFVGE